jgi:hypothetical protein
VGSCLVRYAVLKPCAPSSRHLWLEVGQGGPFIIECVEDPSFAVGNVLWCVRGVVA